MKINQIQKQSSINLAEGKDMKKASSFRESGGDFGGRSRTQRYKDEQYDLRHETTNATDNRKVLLASLKAAMEDGSYRTHDDSVIVKWWQEELLKRGITVGTTWLMKELDKYTEMVERESTKKDVAEGLGKDIKRLTTGKDVKSRAGQEIAKSQDASMKGDPQTSKKHFDRYDKLDKLANKQQGVSEGYILKKTNVDTTFEPGDPDEYYTSGGADVTTKHTDYEIINNKTGQVVGTASWTTNDYFGPGAIKITMKNGATRWLDIWEREKGNPQTAFNRFVKDPKTAKKYKEEISEMDNRTSSGDRREQRASSPEAKAQREKEQQQRLKDTSPNMRKKLRLPEPKEDVLVWKQTSMSLDDALAKYGYTNDVPNAKEEGKNRLGEPIVVVKVPKYSSTKQGVTEGKFFDSDYLFAKDGNKWKETIAGGTGTKEDPYTSKFNGEFRILAVLMRSLALQMAGKDPSDPSQFGSTPNKVYYKFNGELFMGDGTNKIMSVEGPSHNEGVAEGAKWRDPGREGQTWARDDASLPNDLRPGKIPLTKTGNRDINAWADKGTGTTSDPLAWKAAQQNSAGKLTPDDVKFATKKNFSQDVAEGSDDKLVWKQTSMSLDDALAKYGYTNDVPNAKEEGKNRLGEPIVVVKVPKYSSKEQGVTETMDKSILNKRLKEINQQMTIYFTTMKKNPNKPGVSDHYFKLKDEKDVILSQLKQGVSEGSILKSIKRGWQGWRKNSVTPASIQRRAHEYSDDELTQMSTGYEELRGIRAGTPFMRAEVPKHSPEGFQKRVVDREMKKRNLGEEGMAEGASENAWNAGISDEDFIKKFGKSEFDRLTKKYGISSIPVPDLVGYKAKEPTHPKIRLHRGLDGPGATLKSIIKQQGVAEGTLNVKQIKKDLDSGMSADAVIGKHANRRTTNTDEIRRVIQQYAWEKRKNKTKEQGVAEGSEQVYKVVAIDKGSLYDPMTIEVNKPKTLNIQANSTQDVFDRLSGNNWHILSINGVEVINGKRLKQDVAEGLMNTIANKVMGAAPKQPKYKVGQRVEYEASPNQPDWKDGGRGVGVITSYKNGHYIINDNPVNHFEIKGVIDQMYKEGKIMKKEKDSIIEGWDNQLKMLLSESMTITTTSGSAGMGDSISVSATDEDATKLSKILHNAGITVGIQSANDHTDSDGIEIDVQPMAQDEIMSTLTHDDSSDSDMDFMKKVIGIRGAAHDEHDEHKHDDYSEEDDEHCSQCDSDPCECSDEEDDYSDDPVMIGEEDVEEGNEFSGARADAIKAGKETFQVDGKTYRVTGDTKNEDKEMCSECGGLMEQDHVCEQEHEHLDEWANSPRGKSEDEQFETELNFMTNLISGGLNGMKRDQTTLPHTAVKTELSDSMMDFRKLAGLR